MTRLTHLALVALAAGCTSGTETRHEVPVETMRPAPPSGLVEAVVFTTLQPPNWDIYLFDKPGEPPRRLTDDPALDYNAVFSPDGGWIVFTSERTGDAELYRAGAVAAALDAFPGLPLVGYESGEDLAEMKRLGFAVLGRLRVWVAVDR